MVPTIILFVVLASPFFFTPVRLTNPFCYLFFVCMIYFIGKYSYNVAWGTDFLAGVQPAEIVDSFYSLSLFLGTAYAISLPLCQYKSGVAKNNIASEVSKRSTRLRGIEITRSGFILCVFVPIFLVGYGLLKGVNPIENPLLFRQYIQGGGMYYILALALFLINVIAIYVPYQIFVNKKRPQFFPLTCYAILAIFAVVSGFGSFISYYLIAPLFFANACFRVRIELALLILLPFVIFFALVYSSYRDTRLLSNDEISVVEAFSKNANNPDLYATAMNRFDYLESFVLAREYTTTHEPDWGTSMLGVFISPIPRALWKDKPVGFSTFMTKQLYPDVYDIGVTANFNAMNEFTRSFGTLGIFIGGVFFGILLVKLYGIFDRSKGDPFLAVYYVCVIFPYLEGGFLAGFVNDLPLPVLILDSIFFALFIRRSPAIESAKMNRQKFLVQRSLSDHQKGQPA